MALGAHNSLNSLSLSGSLFSPQSSQRTLFLACFILDKGKSPELVFNRLSKFS